MDKIFIKDLSARGIIGVHSEEREKPQEIVINIILFVDTTNAGQSDDIADTVSYSMIAKESPGSCRISSAIHSRSVSRRYRQALFGRTKCDESPGASGKTEGDPICVIGRC